MQFDLTHLGDWSNLAFFNTDLPDIEAALSGAQNPWLPAPENVFAALTACPPDVVKVVILGQDPYPTPGHAHGLAFSAEPHVTPLPRSLANIYKEMQADLGACPPNADLRFLAKQGVLLLNTILTVPAGDAKGHDKLGWQTLTAQILQHLAPTPRAYILWGGTAQKAAKSVSSTHNLKIETPHPSPLSAYRGFFGSRPFSQVNSWLESNGDAPLNWTNPEHS